MIRASVSGVPVKGRDTMGVKFVGLSNGDTVTIIALYPETPEEAAEAADAGESVAEGVVEGVVVEVADSSDGVTPIEAEAATVDPVVSDGDDEEDSGD